MTLAEIKALDKDMLTPAEVAPIIGCDPQQLRMQARERRDLLGFPVVCVGTRTRIPRLPFIQFMEGLA